MSALRKAARAALADAVDLAITAIPALAGARRISAWVQNIDPASLPAIGVATPAEERAVGAMNLDEVRVIGVVVVKRAGGDDLEDQLDDDAEALIGRLEAAMTAAGTDCDLRSSAMDVSGAGSPRIGTLTLTFDLALWADRTQI